MMKKVWLVLLAVVLVFGLVMLGCGSKSSGKPDPDEGGDETPAFSVDGPFKYVMWGTNSPTYDEATDLVSITASSSSGFQIKFEDIGYTYNASDVLVISYYVEVETPEAVLTFKDPLDWSANFNGVKGADWGTGKGVEYALGSTTPIRAGSGTGTLSNYDGPLVKGTYDPATKTGTFEVLVKLLKATTTGIGFQHNVWGDNNGDGVKIAENSKYKLRFTKIENKVAPGGDTDTDEPELTPEEEEEAFDAAVGLKGLTTGGGTDIVLDLENGIISRDVNTGYGAWVSIAIPEAALTPAIIASDKIVVTYIGIGSAPLTTKQSNSNTADVSPNMYNTFNGDGTIRTLVIEAYRYGLTMPTAVITFQGRPNTEAWKLKIIDIKVEHGDPLKVTNLLITDVPAPIKGGTPVSSFSTAQYSGAVVWSGAALDEDGNFALGGVYSTTITLTAQPGYTFIGVEADSFKVAGKAATNAEGTNTSLVVSVTFPAAEGIPDPLVITNPVFTGWGGLGSAGENNTFDMLASVSNNRTSFLFPDGVDVYTDIKVEYTLTRLASGTPANQYMKLTIKDGKKDDWSGDVDITYPQWEDDGDRVYAGKLTSFSKNGALTIAYNSDNSADYTITITKITFSYVE